MQLNLDKNRFSEYNKMMSDFTSEFDWKNKTQGKV